MTQETPNQAGRVQEIQKQINQALEELDRIRNQRQSITTPAELQAAEQAIIEATDKLAALMTGLKIQQALDSDDLKEKADQLVQAMPGGLKNQGKRLVSIQTSTGEPVKVSAQYFSRKKKKKKKIDYGRNGFYSRLLSLGLCDQCTPSMASEVSMLAAMLSSFEETSRLLADQGVGPGINTIRRIAQQYANRAKISQRIEQYPFDESLGRRRVVISTDGGRIRTRKDKPGPEGN